MSKKRKKPQKKLTISNPVVMKVVLCLALVITVAFGVLHSKKARTSEVVAGCSVAVIDVKRPDVAVAAPNKNFISGKKRADRSYSSPFNQGDRR